MIGTDLEAINTLVSVPGKVLHWWPGGPGSPGTYTPLEKLPADIRELYEYNPEKAKKMLADAGYPNGFTLRMNIQAKYEPHSERAALLQDQWSKIGVNLQLDVLETATYTAQRMTQGFPDTQIAPQEIVNPLHLYRWCHSKGTLSMSGYSNPRFDELVEKASATRSEEEANPYTLEAAQIHLREVGYLPLDLTVSSPYWWPWLRNHWGETNVTDANQVNPLYAYMWIDQTMKKDMGY